MYLMKQKISNKSLTLAIPIQCFPTLLATVKIFSET